METLIVPSKLCYFDAPLRRAVVPIFSHKLKSFILAF